MQTHSGCSPSIVLELFLGKDQSQIRHIILFNVLDLGGVEVRVITAKVLRLMAGHIHNIICTQIRVSWW